MLRFISKQIDIRLFKSAFAFAIIYCLLFNSVIIFNKFEYYQASIWSGLLELTKEFIYNIVTLFILFTGLATHRVVFNIGSFVLFITGAIASYYLFFFAIMPTQAIMPTIFGTNPTELYELLSTRMIVWLIFVIVIWMYSISYFNIQASKLFCMQVLSAICILIIVMNIITPKFRFLTSYFPMQYLHNSYIFFFGASKGYAREDISNKFTFIDSSDDDIIGVLVIGESARYDHFGINGYARDTTPNLNIINNIASFKAISCANTTYHSVRCMLSRFDKQHIDLADKETTILSILNKLNFNPMWIGTQSITKFYQKYNKKSFYDEAAFCMIPGGSFIMQPNAHDGTMLPYIQDYLNKTNYSSAQTENNKKKFLVVHTTGSHWHYNKRYPEEFTKFKPIISNRLKTDAAGCDAQELINSYDNSILYADFMISNIIGFLEDKNAFLIYVSDHGESLGELGYFGHGATNREMKEQYEIPLIIWVSDIYKTTNSRKWRAIQSAQDSIVSHDNIFHSILDLLDIKSNIIDNKLSLCYI